MRCHPPPERPPPERIIRLSKREAAPGDPPSFIYDPAIVDARVMRGPEYWWWTDAECMKITAVLVVLR
jgi:hypothetical protein